jgi:hypothetical protein
MLINAASTKDRMPLRDLARLALKMIFEEKACTGQEVAIVNNQVKNWNQLIQFQKSIALKKYGLDPATTFIPIGKKGSVVDEWEYFLQTICLWLVKNEQGEFDKMKGLWRQHNINYKKTQRFGWLFPEVYTKEGFAKAQKALEHAKRINPDDYR